MVFPGIGARRSTVLALILFVLAPFFQLSVLAAGGTISGKVTNPLGEPVANAVMTITQTTTGKTFPAKTDRGGNFRVEGLPPGTYSVTVVFKGFSDFKSDPVEVGEAQTVSVNVSLELPPTTETTVVSATPNRSTDNPLYRQLRAAQENPVFASSATVKDLVLKRDTGIFRLQTGTIYFLAPIQNRITGAVFEGEGTFEITPPTDVEKQSLSIFTKSPKLVEPFSTLALRFTDNTFDEIKGSPNATFSETRTDRGPAVEQYKKYTNLLRRKLKSNLDIRTLMNLFEERFPGYFVSFINGREHSKLMFLTDPLGIPAVFPEQVALLSYGESDGGIWTAHYLAGSYARGTGHSGMDRRLFDFKSHKIDATIKGTILQATDTVEILPRGKNLRVVPVDLFPTLRISKVRNETGEELQFIQEKKDEDADVAVLLKTPTENGKPFRLTFEYEGNQALYDSGSGNFILLPQARSNWYPNNGETQSGGFQTGDRATFDMTFHYSKKYVLVGTCDPVEEKEEGDLKTGRWSSGTTELTVSGFNIGQFKKKAVSDQVTGYTIEFYSNKELPSELQAVQRQIEMAETLGGEQTETTLGSMSTSGMADSAIAQGQNSTRIYDNFFGKLPYKRVALSQQPAANFGQAWPTLVFMPYTAFIDTTQRAQLFGARGGTDTFWEYVGPHEVAHQWWGHIVGWTSYHDQWMSEGFAEFSTSLYVQYNLRDINKFRQFWEAQRRLIVEASPSTENRKPYTIGPVTQGYRLNTGKTGSVAQRMIYPKGAYILHMIRMMMYQSTAEDPDGAFKDMMKDFVQSNFNRDITTDDFRKAIERHIQPQMDIDKNKTMNWFFDQWVQGCEMPSYNFTYSLQTVNGQTKLVGKLTQSGVSANFYMLVPIYIDYGKGWKRIGTIPILGNSTKDIELPFTQAPKAASICAMNDVLAEKIENVKQ